MNNQQDQELGPVATLRLWSYADAVKALPYLRVIVASLRDHWLELQKARHEARQVAAGPIRQNRQSLIQQIEVIKAVATAEANVDETVQELLTLGACSVDPLRGLALIPFNQNGELAWFVYDLFSPGGLTGWRFHLDPLQTRRPLVDVHDRPTTIKLQLFGA